MKEQLDLVKILKDCPVGMELDCEIFNGTVIFSRIVNDEQYPIEIKIDDDYKEYLTKYGSYVDRSFCKCVIFPKGKTTWEGFQRPFVDGDIVINKNNIGTWIGIYHKDDRLNETFSSYCYIRRDGIFCANSDNNHGYYETRLATKEEKEKFFQVIKDHGYKWNPETKTLEKLIVPKFKDGDIVATNDGKYIAIIKNNGGKYYVCCHPNVNYFYIDRSGWFDRLATLEEKEKLFAAIKENGYKWNAKTKTLEKLIVPKFKVGDKIKHKDTVLTIISVRTNSYIIENDPDNFGILMFSGQDNWELIPNKFDPKTLKPFESKVLVSNYGKWAPAIFGYYNKEHSNVIVVVGGNFYTKCIPYEGNEHLIDTYDQPSEFYRYWED